MRSQNTFGIHFILRMNKVKNGKAPLYARITVNTSRIEVSLKTLVETADWNSSKGLAKPKNEKAKELNSFLEQVRGQFADCYKQLQLQKKIINAEAIKNLFLGNDKKEHTLCSLMEYHNINMRSVLSHGTLKNYFTTSKYLTKFLKAQYKTADIYLANLSYQFISEFELFLRKHTPTDHQKRLQNNGVMKHLERLRKMVRLAVKMEWIAKNPFENYQLKFQKVERSYLTDAELASIENKEFGVERLDWVRDLFIFSCYTGLAYIDTMRLTPTNVVRGIDGEYWLITSRQKTEIAVKVPLLPKALGIINKYKDHPKAFVHHTLFPNISNQKLNSYLKEIADVCGIDKHLTFHLARHTFATTVTLSNGVPIESVSKMLGHTKITTTQIYAKVIERKLSDDMKTLRDKLGDMQNKRVTIFVK
jgi:site-specific recombinase XerD